MRRFWIALGIFVAMVGLGFLALNLWVHSYLRSAAFRQLVTAKTGQALRADVDAQPLDWSGSSVYSAAFTGRGAAGAPLETFAAEQVRATVNWRAILERAWRVDRLEIVRFDAKVRTGSRQAVTAKNSGPTPDAPPPSGGFLPNRFELKRVDVQNASVEIEDFGRLRGTALVVQPEGDGWVFDGTGGRLESPHRPTLDVGSFRVRLQQGVIYLTDAAVRLGAYGAITASGDAGRPDVPFHARVQWQNVDAADVLDATWKRRVSGTLSGETDIVGRVGLPAVTTGKFFLADGSLEGLPVQKEIAQFTRSPQFDRMPLHEVSGDFTTDGTTTVVKNFVTDSPGLLRVEGAFRIGAAGALEGAFRLGVTSQSLQWLPGSQEKVFTAAEGGYLWTNVKIGGTIEQPTEDLSARLARAMGEQVIDTGIQLIEGSPPNATDAVKRAVDILSPLIP